MIRRPLVFGISAFALALAACDGGGDGDATPTPSPTASPTPTPTTSPTYAALPAAAVTEFFSVSATTGYSGDLTTGPVVLNPAVTETRSDRVRLAVSNVTTGTFVIREALEESRFSATTPSGATGTYTLATAPAAGVNEYVFRITEPSPVGKFAEGEFLNNTITGAVTADPFFSTLTRVSYASWLRADSTAGAKRIAYTTWGFPSVYTDLPTTGTSTYTARIVGRAIQVGAAGTGTLVRLGGTATITVNWGTGSVNSTLNVTTVGAGGAETAYGTFTGTGGIPTSSNQFSGSFAAASPIPGTFQGGFYGSQGEEIAISFAGLGTAGALDTRIVGVVVANKD